MSGCNMAGAARSALTESLLIETAHAGVTVIDFRPGDYRTDFNPAMFARSTNHSAADATARCFAAARATIEADLASAALPARAAGDLWRAVGGGRSGVVRSGGFFQPVSAPVVQRLVPASLARRGRWWYFGLR